MNPPFRCVAPFLLISLLAASSIFAAGERNNFDLLQFSTGTFHGCAPTGTGSDPYLNNLKNRDVPPTQARVYTRTQLLNAAGNYLSSPNAIYRAADWDKLQMRIQRRFSSSKISG
jgi:hypothetical protein